MGYHTSQTLKFGDICNVKYSRVPGRSTAESIEYSRVPWGYRLAAVMDLPEYGTAQYSDNDLPEKIEICLR